MHGCGNVEETPLSFCLFLTVVPIPQATHTYVDRRNAIWVWRYDINHNRIDRYFWCFSSPLRFFLLACFSFLAASIYHYYMSIDRWWGHVKPVVRAIEVFHAACKDEFVRRNLRSHSWRLFIILLCPRSIFSNRSPNGDRIPGQKEAVPGTGSM